MIVPVFNRKGGIITLSRGNESISMPVTDFGQFVEFCKFFRSQTNALTQLVTEYPATEENDNVQA